MDSRRKKHVSWDLNSSWPWEKEGKKNWSLKRKKSNTSLRNLKKKKSFSCGHPGLMRVACVRLRLEAGYSVEGWLPSSSRTPHSILTRILEFCVQPNCAGCISRVCVLDIQIRWKDLLSTIPCHKGQLVDRFMVRWALDSGGICNHIYGWAWRKWRPSCSLLYYFFIWWQTPFWVHTEIYLPLPLTPCHYIFYLFYIIYLFVFTSCLH